MGKRESQSVRCHSAGLERAKEALRRLYKGNMSFLVSSKEGCDFPSYSTVKKFFAGGEVGIASFEAICQALELNCQEIARLPEQERSPQAERIEKDSAKQRRQPLEPASESISCNIDRRNVIVNYNLHSQMAELKRVFRYTGGAFAFTAWGVSDRLLENYLIERVESELRELRRGMREVQSQTIRLTALESGVSIEENLLAELKQLMQSTDLSTPAKAFSNVKPPDLILSIWNYDFPPKYFKSVVESAWEAIRRDSSLLLGDRCLIIVWISVGPLAFKIEDENFGDLAITNPFDSEELKLWFRDHFEEWRIPESSQKEYLDRLGKKCSSLVGTYLEMEDILDELQRGVG